MKFDIACFTFNLAFLLKGEKNYVICMVDREKEDKEKER